MPYLKGIIRLSLVMAILCVAALVTSHFAIQDLADRRSDVMADWVKLRVSMGVMIVFIAITVIALSKALRRLRRPDR